MSWPAATIAWLALLIAFIVVWNWLLPTPAQQCELYGGRFITLDGVTACIGGR